MMTKVMEVWARIVKWSDGRVVVIVARTNLRPVDLNQEQPYPKISDRAVRFMSVTTR